MLPGFLQRAKQRHAQRPGCHCSDHASEAGKAQVRNHAVAEDIHHFVELALVERVGSLGRKLHTGRSRNEQIATDLRLYVRTQIDRVITSLSMGRSAVGAGASSGRGSDAELHASAACRAGAGGALAAGLCGDDSARRSRLMDCAARFNCCPLGSGAVAGATLALDRTIATRELAIRWAHCELNGRDQRPRFCSRVSAGA